MLKVRRYQPQKIQSSHLKIKQDSIFIYIYIKKKKLLNDKMMQTLLFLKNLGKHVLFKTCYRIYFPNFNWCTIPQSCCRNSESASSLCFSSIFRTNSIITQNLLLVVHYKKVTSVELKCIKFCRQSLRRVHTRGSLFQWTAGLYCHTCTLNSWL